MFFYIAKCLDDNEDELEDVSKLTPTPIGAESSEISSTPIEENVETEPVETAQEALSLLNACPADDVTPTPTTDVCDSKSADTTKGERRTSHSWKGFKFKKQLSKVDLKIKNTFSTQSEKANKKTSMFHVSNQPTVLDAPSEQSPEEESVISDDGNIPEIREPCDKSSEQVTGENTPNRPTDLNLFETDIEKPARPERRKDRKRFSLEKQAPRDTRLLSVPNIKYQHVGKDTKKSKSSNNQAFFSLIRRLSKFH